MELVEEGIVGIVVVEMALKTKDLWKKMTLGQVTLVLSLYNFHLLSINHVIK